MKRVLILATLAVSLTACSPSESVSSDKPTPAKPHPIYKVEKEVPTITPYVGLGDSVSAFESKYGKNQGDESFGRFADDAVMPTFVKGHAYLVMLQFGKTSQPVRSKEETLVEVKKAIPKDAQLLKEYEDAANQRYVFHYKSKSLGEALGAESFGSAPLGEFVVVMRQSDKRAGYTYVAIGAGNQP